MFYHVVTMHLTEAADAQFHRKVEAYAQRVRRECTGIVHYHYCRNMAARAKGYTHVVAGVFESSEAHDNYQVSPAHQEMKNYMMPFIADMVVFDSDPVADSASKG
ncbi:MAG: Dabb family protein [Burkholderiaceae bacterium]|nr:Dabb family protein [Burkholderiaceae bacterium]